MVSKRPVTPLASVIIPPYVFSKISGCLASAFFTCSRAGLRPFLSWNSFSTVMASVTAPWAFLASSMVPAFASFSLPRISVALAMALSSCTSSACKVTMSSPREIMEAFRRSMSAFSSSTRTVLTLRVFLLAFSSELHQVFCSPSCSTSSTSLVTLSSIMCLTPSRLDDSATGCTRLRRAALCSLCASLERNGTILALIKSLPRPLRRAASEEPFLPFTCSKLRHFTSRRESFSDTTLTALATASNSSLRIFWLDSKSAAFCRHVDVTSSKYFVSASLDAVAVVFSSSNEAFNANFLFFSVALRVWSWDSASAWSLRLAIIILWL
mmetsp:Transcript_37601/g.70120  ORF Transcript_37601/g.70120 Transcript_37601/m.70120 type:complete len:325 (-) Transcript_37601:715-1689(-)